MGWGGGNVKIKDLVREMRKELCICLWFYGRRERGYLRGIEWIIKEGLGDMN